jgi:hypothetical protein
MQGAILVHTPSYIPDFVPSNFHMFGPKEEALRRSRFSSGIKVIGAVRNWLKTQPKNFFSDEIKKHVKRWNRCVEVEGDYI